MDDSRVSELINKAKSNDVEVKVDALTKLQAELEAGAEVLDAETVISTLKACLKVSHQHLTTAAVSVIPSLLPLIIPTGQHNHRQTHQRSLSNSTSTSSITASIDAFNLRQALTAFLTPGGLFERLGDSREKPRDKARESLVLLGGYAFKFAGGSAFASKSTTSKGPETPLAMFERFMKEGGFGSKVWRIREQSILVLLHIRRSHPSFTLRSYLPPLVAVLEDSDSNVRECAKQSLVELFTSPGVTDAARADLKKEMTKKGVRKATMDSVLSQVLSASTSSFTSAPSNELSQSEGKKEYVPPSLALLGKTPSTLSNGSGSTTGPTVMARARTTSRGNTGPKVLSRPPSRAGVASPTPTEASGGVGTGSTTSGGTNLADIRNVYVASSRDLENEFAKMEKPFQGKETEHNWSTREQAINHVRGMVKGGDVLERYYDTFMAHLKQFLEWSLKTLVSLRTTVAVNTCFLYTELVVALETAFDHVCELVLNNLLKMAGFTKKLVAQQSQATVTVILKHTSPQPRTIPHLLWCTLQDKIAQARAYASGHIKTYVEIHASKAKHAIETSGGLDTLVNSIKKALGDPNPGVRENARHAYWLLNSVWKDKGAAIMASLDPSARKQLERVCPDSKSLSGPAESTPQTKKSSVAAVIAASRAKAKAIAIDPPTLRHQATSTARTTTSPKRPLSPSLSNSSVGSPPRPRPVVMSSHTRTTTNTSTTSRSPRRDPLSLQHTITTPPSSSHSFDSVRRRTPTTASVSPTTPGSPTFRRAVSTSLPLSPPSPSSHLPPPLTPPKREDHLGPSRPSIANWSKLIEDESLLVATTVPIPEDDSDFEDDDMNANPVTFSSPFEMFPPKKTKSSPVTPSFTTSSADEPKHQMLHSMSSSSFATHSPPATTPQPIVEDAMRARAEQAASAADRLMELVDQDLDDDSTVLMDLDDDGDPHDTNGSLLLRTPVGERNRKSHDGTTENAVGNVRIAATLPLRTGKSQVPKVTNIWGGKITTEVPRTPAIDRGSKEARDQRGAAIMKQAALLLDSPVAAKNSGLATDGSGTDARPTGSVLDLLREKKTGRDWWVKRMTLHRQSLAINGSQLDHAEQFDELQRHIKSLENGSAGVDCLQKLAMFSTLYPVPETLSSLSQDSNFSIAGLPQWTIPKGNEFWAKERSCDRLFDALRRLLDPSKEGALLEYGLIVLWELIENQTPYLEGKEADVFSLLLWIRYSGKPNVFEATFAIRDALTDRIEAVYGLTTMHGCVKSFASLPPPDVEDSAGLKTMSYCFGLSALGKFIRRLPGEILEEELPRLKDTLISALTDTSSLLIRESAAAVIITAQLVLRDEAQLFSLLEELPDDKKNLLTYLFERHDARNISPSTSAGDTTIMDNKDKGFEKLSKELSRLDRRMSTPPSGRTL